MLAKILFFNLCRNIWIKLESGSITEAFTGSVCWLMNLWFVQHCRVLRFFDLTPLVIPLINFSRSWIRLYWNRRLTVQCGFSSVSEFDSPGAVCIHQSLICVYVPCCVVGLKFNQMYRTKCWKKLLKLCTEKAETLYSVFINETESLIKRSSGKF